MHHQVKIAKKGKTTMSDGISIIARTAEESLSETVGFEKVAGTSEMPLGRMNVLKFAETEALTTKLKYLIL